MDLWRGLVISDGIFLFVLLDDSESWRTMDEEIKYIFAACDRHEDV